MSRRVAAALLGALLVVLVRPAHAWIENRVLGDEVRIELERDGKALVEHRITLRTNGNQRFKRYAIRDVDRDAAPEKGAYAVPARDALSSSLESAVPLLVELVYPEKKRNMDEAPPAELRLAVDDPKGLRRGTYVLVLRYRTDLRARGLLVQDGSLVRIGWRGPRFDDGFDNARVVFALPAAPTAPHALEPVASEDAEEQGSMPPTYLSEVHRSTERDEIELLRPYAPADEPVLWEIRADPRALEPLPRPEVEEAPPPAPPSPMAEPRSRRIALAAGAALFIAYLLLVWLKGREVLAHAKEARAMVAPVVPVRPFFRGLLAAALLTGGVALQIVFGQPVAGAILVVLAAATAAHGAARLDPSAGLRGPGRWLTVSEREGLAKLPRLSGAYLDVSTWAGKLLLILLLGGVGAAAVLSWPISHAHALLIGFDAVALLAVFGTGTLASLPPDLAVEPARFLRPLARRLKKMKGAGELRIVPRIRIPHGGVDPDELRLLVVPRVPLRGFGGIEVGVCYALGVGARVALPEVLVRVQADSPCDRALAAVSARARITPGRKPDERVIAFSPRLPTLRMTAQITLALAARVVDREALAPARPATKDPRPLADAA